MTGEPNHHPVTDGSAPTARVVAVCSSAVHAFSKQPQPTIRLVAGVGVAGDSHAGETVQHRSRVRRDPTQPNLRQVHVVHAELYDEVRELGYDIGPGDIGENVAVRGLAVLGLGVGTRLRLGSDAVVEVTGLRNPCTQLDGFAAGLMRAMLDRDPDDALIRKAGVMGVVVQGGIVRAEDPVRVEPPAVHVPLVPV